MAEKLLNNARSNLNGAINSTTTTITVNNASAFPITGVYRIGIDAEIMLVSSVSGNVLTVTRAAEGTTGAAHADGSVVAVILTAQGLAQYILEHGTGSAGIATSLPAAGNQGALYYATDQPVMFRDTGTIWQAFGPLYPLNLPKLSDFTWFNQGTLTVAGGAANNAPLYVEGANNVMAFLYKAAPTPPYSIVYGWQFNPNRQADPRAGPCWYDTVGHNLVTCSFDYTGPVTTTTQQQVVLYITQWTASGGTFSAHAFSNALWPMNMFWCRIRDDNTNRYVDYSVDGKNFINVYSTSRTTFLTPTSVGMQFFSNHTSNIVGTTWWHYKEN